MSLLDGIIYRLDVVLAVRKRNRAYRRWASATKTGDPKITWPLRHDLDTAEWELGRLLKERK